MRAPDALDLRIAQLVRTGTPLPRRDDIARRLADYIDEPGFVYPDEAGPNGCYRYWRGVGLDLVRAALEAGVPEADAVRAAEPFHALVDALRHRLRKHVWRWRYGKLARPPLHWPPLWDDAAQLAADLHRLTKRSEPCETAA